jgi:DNA polymerase III sliding clamp (beta) subunit (PCNA family)
MNTETLLSPITINANALRAALHCVADKKDPRYYLQGVFVKIKRGSTGDHPRALVAGTNGHILFVGLSEVDTVGAVEDLNAWFDQSMIIPIDVIKALDKRAQIVQLAQIDADTFRLGNMVFTPIDGAYPDIARVIPAREQLGRQEQTPAVYNPDYLARANKAMQTYYQSKPDTTFPLAQFGDSAGIVHAGENCAQVVIMPIRANGMQGSDNLQSFNRDYL